MFSWTPEQWGTFLLELGTFIGVLFTSWTSLKARLRADANAVTIDATSKKTESISVMANSLVRDLADNTQKTVDGTEKATNTAAQAKESISEIKQALNGQLDEKIDTAIRLHTEPIVASIRAHAEQDDKNMKEIRDALGELRDWTKMKGATQ